MSHERKFSEGLHADYVLVLLFMFVFALPSFPPSPAGGVACSLPQQRRRHHTACQSFFFFFLS